ncbi:hypothetical protein SAMN05444722_1293 [Rhodovulum sp. ES.010]|uniref:hypothetical protein n=1 Tax=Rhodovulum sp. ES.010 TaxID=1882821 RepID=UPI00092A7AC1|nr:hypothetical protein [Rhodovulum sp. ES.010]SIO29956.1 hypothetical protein SAMN05444722_1293 [Rhodovulum sp. ES.010]
MDYTIVDEDFAQPAPGRARALVTPKLHAVTPEAGLREWDGVPSFGVVAFIGYLIALAVLFSNQLVPYCVENFAQPQNCAPIFDKVLPIALAAIVLGPAVNAAVRRMGGNRTSGLAFALTAMVMPPLILGWHYLV